MSRLEINCQHYDSKVVNYNCIMFIRWSVGLVQKAEWIMTFRIFVKCIKKLIFQFSFFPKNCWHLQTKKMVRSWSTILLYVFRASSIVWYIFCSEIKGTFTLGTYCNHAFWSLHVEWRLQVLLYLNVFCSRHQNTCLRCA